jgi:ATP-dependent Clp endopeptidase proteolytic subunit ClpP
MSKLQLFKPQAFERPESLQWDAPSNALERWAAIPHAAEADQANTVSIYDVIGEDPWTGGGFTARRMSAALRAIGAKDVTVNVNSPGGDMFEGLAIYNLLAEHPGEVTVRVMGLAASAASVLAMAGDRIEMGLGSFLMIHNSWGVVIGNQNDMRDAASLFAQFDGAMADIYAHRSGQGKDKIEEWMHADTWMSASDAVALGFASGTFEAPKGEPNARADVSARRRLDAMLAKGGMPRSERRRLLREAAGTLDAADHDTPRAVYFDPALVAAVINTIRS